MSTSPALDALLKPLEYASGHLHAVKGLKPLLENALSKSPELDAQSRAELVAALPEIDSTDDAARLDAITRVAETIRQLKAQTVRPPLELVPDEPAPPKL